MAKSCPRLNEIRPLEKYKGRQTGRLSAHLSLQPIISLALMFAAITATPTTTKIKTTTAFSSAYLVAIARLAPRGQALGGKQADRVARVHGVAQNKVHPHVHGESGPPLLRERSTGRLLLLEASPVDRPAHSRQLLQAGRHEFRHYTVAKKKNMVKKTKKVVSAASVLH